MIEGTVIFSKGSTIVDCSSDKIKILREGPITKEQIKNALKKKVNSIYNIKRKKERKEKADEKKKKEIKE